MEDKNGNGKSILPSEMSNRAARILLDLPFHPNFSKVSSSAIKLAMGLLKFTNESAEAWPSQETLCKTTGISSKNTLKDGERQLIESGILKTEFLPTGMRGKKYKFLIEPKRTLPVIPDLSEWKNQEIPKGYVGFSPPSSANLAFYKSRTLHLL